MVSVGAAVTAARTVALSLASGAGLLLPAASVMTALMLAFAYQIAVPGLAATLLWFALVGRVGAVRASTFHFLNPFFGVCVAAALLGEKIGVLDMIGVAIAAAGILAVQLSRMKAA